VVLSDKTDNSNISLTTLGNYIDSGFHSTSTGATPNYATSFRSGQVGLIRCNFAGDNINVQVPQYTPTVAICNAACLVNFSKSYGVPVSSGCYPGQTLSITSSSAAGHSLFVAGGDDYSLGGFVSIPPIVHA